MFEKLRVAVGPNHRKLNFPVQGLPDQTGAGRLNRLRHLVTGLFRYERIESGEVQIKEVQPYVELLIMEALRFGPRHVPTMELMDFWMLEKDLIHRMFKVYVPRFARFEAPYTKTWYVPTPRSTLTLNQMLLELKGHPYPPVEPRHLDNKSSLANLLLAEAKRDYVRQKLRAQSETTRQEAASNLDGQSSG